jgi:hypothetical protein
MMAADHGHAMETAPKPPAWFDQLAATSTPEDVARVAREFVARWTPEELAQLPRSCRPGNLKFPEEVVDYAFTLVRAHVDGQSANEAITRMATFFAEASWRVAAAMSAREAEEAHNDGTY